MPSFRVQKKLILTGVLAMTISAVGCGPVGFTNSSDLHSSVAASSVVSSPASDSTDSGGSGGSGNLAPSSETVNGAIYTNPNSIPGGGSSPGTSGTPGTSSTTTSTTGTTNNRFTPPPRRPRSASTGDSGGAGTSNGTSPTVKAFQPALAVRDISCLACHAQVNANIITDFGYSDPWYLNESGSRSDDFGGAHYTVADWQSLNQVIGQIIVPSSATIPSSISQSAIAPGGQLPAEPLSLLEFLTTTDVIDYLGDWATYWKTSMPPNWSFTARVTPIEAASPAVVTQDSIFIGTPTESEILALVPNAPASSSWIQVLGAASPGLNGLAPVTGVNGASYISNFDPTTGQSLGPINCSNMDVVIKGTLLLSKAQIMAEKNGCRIYVTGSVFIEGPITYLQSTTKADPTTNLQITSATSIIMGVGLEGSVWNGTGDGEETMDKGTQDANQYSTEPLNTRLLGDIRANMLLRRAPTADSYSAYAAGIMAEGTNIGSALLADATDPDGLPTALSGAGQARASVDFTHLLLNAPMIHSRYLGSVTGVIVAESAMFSLGEFSFAYDPVFESVPILPALPYDILCAGSTCLPTQ